MARYIDAIDLPLPVEQAFDYLADFSRTVEWDPGVVESERVTGGAIRLGSRFRVKISFLGRRFPLEYQITAFERPSRLVLTGGGDGLRSIDEITLVSRPGGTRVCYEARVELSGLRRLADPFLDLLFQRIGRVAVRGLRERLAETGSKPTAGRGPEKKALAGRGLGGKRTRSVRAHRQNLMKEGVAR